MPSPCGSSRLWSCLWERLVQHERREKLHAIFLGLCFCHLARLWPLSSTPSATEEDSLFLLPLRLRAFA